MKFADRIHRRRRAQRPDHRSRRLGVAPGLSRRQGLAWPERLGQRVATAIPRRTDFFDTVQRTLSETAFDPTRLEIELTKRAARQRRYRGSRHAAAARTRRAAGVDDFGTGYSSLLYLRRLPFDKLKIDRNSFVLSIEKAADAAAIVHAVVSLGRGLGMKVTAEGVETADQHLFLRAAGVHFMQGYRFGKAVRRRDHRLLAIARRLQADRRAAGARRLAANFTAVNSNSARLAPRKYCRRRPRIVSPRWRGLRSLRPTSE